jgi:hypothetical protein
MFLGTDDPEKRSQMSAIAAEVQRLYLDLNDDLSNKIISKLAEAMK